MNARHSAKNQQALPPLELSMPEPDLEPAMEDAILALAALTAAIAREVDASGLDRHIAAAYRSRGNSPVQALAGIAAGLQRVDLAVPLAFLDNLQRILPEAVPVAPKDRATQAGLRDFFQELSIDAANCGALDNYYAPQPAIEAWVGSIVALVRDRLQGALPFQAAQPRQAAQLACSALLVVHQYLTPLESLVHNRRAEGEKTGYMSMGAHGLWELRSSISTALFHELALLWKNGQGMGFLEEVKNTCEMIKKVKRMNLSSPDGDRAPSVRLVSWLLTSADDVSRASRDAAALNHLNDFCAALARHQLAAADAPPVDMRQLPVGQVILLVLNDAAPNPVLASYDGRRQQVSVATVVPGTQHKFALNYCDAPRKSYFEVTYPGMLGFSIDTNGKLYTSLGHRLAPPAAGAAAYAQTAAVVRRIEAECYRLLHEEWRLNGGLFSSLRDASPIVLMFTPHGTVQIGDDSLPADLRVGEVVEIPSTLRNFFGSLYARGFEGRLLYEYNAAREVLPEDDLSLPEQSAWQRIYRCLPGGKFGLGWLMEHLEPLGAVRVTEKRGKGSHYMLQFSRADGEHGSYSLSQHFRRDSSVANLLKKVLKPLNVSLEEFADSLEARS